MLILRRQTTISLGGLSQTFNGTPRQVTVTTQPAGVPVAVTYNGSLTPPSAVGNYTVVASVTDSNYSGTITGVMAITAAPGPNSLAKIPSGPGDPGAENLLILSWDSVSSPVTLFHSSDLISWEEFGTTDGSTNAMVLPNKPGAHFFRATVENADGFQGVPLKLRPQTSMP